MLDAHKSSGLGEVILSQTSAKRMRKADEKWGKSEANGSTMKDTSKRFLNVHLSISPIASGDNKGGVSQIPYVTVIFMLFQQGPCWKIKYFSGLTLSSGKEMLYIIHMYISWRVVCMYNVHLLYVYIVLFFNVSFPDLHHTIPLMKAIFGASVFGE